MRKWKRIRIFWMTWVPINWNVWIVLETFLKIEFFFQNAFKIHTKIGSNSFSNGITAGRQSNMGKGGGPFAFNYWVRASIRCEFFQRFVASFILVVCLYCDLRWNYLRKQFVLHTEIYDIVMESQQFECNSKLNPVLRMAIMRKVICYLN